MGFAVLFFLGNHPSYPPGTATERSYAPSPLPPGAGALDRGLRRRRRRSRSRARTTACQRLAPRRSSPRRPPRIRPHRRPRRKSPRRKKPATRRRRSRRSELMSLVRGVRPEERTTILDRPQSQFECASAGSATRVRAKMPRGVLGGEQRGTGGYHCCLLGGNSQPWLWQRVLESAARENCHSHDVSEKILAEAWPNPEDGPEAAENSRRGGSGQKAQAHVRARLDGRSGVDQTPGKTCA